jgi:2-octaprenyl-6-methoxyphenol hydroxylase
MKGQGAARWDFDVVIAGGGLVGAALALALARLPLRIALVEARRPPATAPGAPPSADDDPRCTAFAAGSVRILETLGVWERVAHAAVPIRTIHVSDRGQWGATRLRCEDHGVDALGYVLENAVLANTLWSLLGQLPRTGDFRSGETGTAPGDGRAGLTVCAPASVVAATCQEGCARLRVRGVDGAEQSLTAGLLVVADGARSGLRDMLGIACQERPYRQHAIIANVTPARFHEHVAYERFTSSGPLAVLPMQAGRCNLVWTVWQDEVGALMALDDVDFLAALQSRFGYRAGRLLRVSRRSAYPLSLTHTQESALPPRCVLLGNAATGVHPVAGQGLNLALRDVARLADCVADALTAGVLDTGDPRLIGALTSWRRDDHRRIVSFTDGLIRLFTQPSAVLGGARGLGLVALDLLPAARASLARQAMGLDGRLPRLARGVALPAPAPAATGSSSSPATAASMREEAVGP